MPSDTVTATRCRRCSSCRPNQTSPSAHALAAFSTATGSPVADSSICRRSTSRQPRFGANTSRPAASTRPGRLTPTPSHTIRGCAARRLAIVRATEPDEHRRIAGRGKRPLRLEPRVHVRQPHGRRLGPEVHAHDARALDVEVQKPGPPPARQPADGSLGDPPLVDQLVDDGRDRAALEPRAARQIRPRHRLVMPEEIQRDPPVDLPRGLARGDLEVRQIDLAHGVGELYQSRQSAVGVVSRSPQSQSSVAVVSPQSSVPVGSPTQQSQSTDDSGLTTGDCDSTGTDDCD